MNNLAYCRKNRGLSQRAVAKILNMRQSNISDWEAGKYKPTIDNLCVLADFYGCSIDYLVGRESEDGIIVIDGERVSQDVGPADRIYNQLNDRNKFRFLTYGQGLLDGQGK